MPALEFFLFAATLLGIAVFHRHALQIVLCGLAVVVLYKFAVTGFPPGPGLAGLAQHLTHEWVTLANLFGLITGFALLANHFHHSALPPGWPCAGCFPRAARYSHGCAPDGMSPSPT